MLMHVNLLRWPPPAPDTNSGDGTPFYANDDIACYNSSLNFNLQGNEKIQNKHQEGRPLAAILRASSYDTVHKTGGGSVLSTSEAAEDAPAPVCFALHKQRITTTSDTENFEEILLKQI